ncbi:MAG: single-stranded DNA-binding protein [Candidatus Cryptobacteroides sp.]
MESINRVEILGNVGNIRIQEAGERKVIHLSVVTNRVARNRNGENYVETTWHHVEAWEGQQNIVDFQKITKGCWVRAVGRLKTNSYTNSDNVEKYTMDIVASRLEVVVEEMK